MKTCHHSPPNDVCDVFKILVDTLGVADRGETLSIVDLRNGQKFTKRFTDSSCPDDHFKIPPCT